MEPSHPWNVGDTYLVHSPQGGVMGKLIEVTPIELVFERVDCTPPELASVSDERKIYCGSGVVIISRYSVSGAEKMTAKQI